MTKKRAECCVVAVITDRQGRVLMTQRDRPPKVGIWHMPGGGVDFGEEHIDAVVREAREEVGVEIAVTDHRPLFVSSALYPDVDRHVVAIYFSAVIVSGTPRPLDATRKVQWADQRTVRKWLRQEALLESCRRALEHMMGWRLPPKD